MTLLIGALSGPGLNPDNENFTFEPGIVIAADTRYTIPNKPPIDDGLKVAPAGPYSICGMASDDIDIPTSAFHFFDAFMQTHPDISGSSASEELQRYLQNAHRVTCSKRGKLDLVTNVFFGHQEVSTNFFCLYRLDSKDNFLPKIVSGFDAAGSHKHYVMESFELTKHQYPTLTLRPFNGFPNDYVTVREGVAALVAMIIVSAIDVAKETEARTGKSEGIGGTYQISAVTLDGPRVSDPLTYDKLKALQIFGSGIE